jgi:hypothetical protein
MKWEHVRVRLQCAYGCAIPRGELALIGRRRFCLCRSCARQRYRMRPPSRLRPNMPDVLDFEHDGKAEQMPTGDR